MSSRTRAAPARLSRRTISAGFPPAFACFSVLFRAMRTVEFDEPEEAKPDPLRAMCRLAAAILAQAAADFMNSRDLYVARRGAISLPPKGIRAEAFPLDVGMLCRQSGMASSAPGSRAHSDQSVGRRSNLPELRHSAAGVAAPQSPGCAWATGECLAKVRRGDAPEKAHDTRSQCCSQQNRKRVNEALCTSALCESQGISRWDLNGPERPPEQSLKEAIWPR